MILHGKDIWGLHFFWPAMKADVVRYCNTCHTCQLAGKPNQKVPPAPLCPIPAVGEPFEHVLVDCVGPLPRTRAGNQFLLTIMCLSTRFTEAIPLRRITMANITNALFKFFTTFGLPKTVQTDQGTNFLSQAFKLTLISLGISYSVSSAYHPESQGALERWHQMLKAMLKKYCHDTGRSWDEDVPFVLFAIRDAKQGSLGFSPAALVFGCDVRGPLKVLKEGFLGGGVPKTDMTDFVKTCRDRWQHATSLAKEALCTSQGSMKKWYDRKAVKRHFQPGDKVLMLLLVPSSALLAHFAGHYVIVRKVSKTDYVISTPECRRKTCLCHINMLKPYHDRETH
uniref:Gypsy retrotransposon integrase-like protein 1 n=1 Tax=Oreochromis niloticus TaxID=8128 RepID=A0A669CLV6_ORENI